MFVVLIVLKERRSNGYILIGRSKLVLGTSNVTYRVVALNSSSYPRYFANEASGNADSVRNYERGHDDATRRWIETYVGARVRSSPPITRQISASQLILRLRLLQGRSVMHTTALCNLGRRSVPSRPPRLVARPPRLVSVRPRHVYEPKQKE